MFVSSIYTHKNFEEEEKRLVCFREKSKKMGNLEMFVTNDSYFLPLFIFTTSKFGFEIHLKLKSTPCNL